MNPMLRRAAWPVAGLLVSLVGGIAVVRGVDTQHTLATLAAVNPWPLLLAGSALVAQLWIRTLRWSLLLPVAGPRVPAARLVPVVLVGYLGNAVFPARLGEVLRAVVASRREAVTAAAALGSVLVERAIDMLALVLLALPALWLAGAPDWLTRATLVAAAIAAGIVGVAQTRLAPAIVAQLRARASAARWSACIDRAAQLVQAMRGSGRMRAFGLAFGLSLVTWCLDGVIYWSAATALGISLSPAAALVVSAMSVLGTAVPSAPGYLGVFELVAATVAQVLGVPAAPALAFAILAHAISVVPLAAGGALSALWLGVRVRGVSRQAAT